MIEPEKMTETEKKQLAKKFSKVMNKFFNEINTPKFKFIRPFYGKIDRIILESSFEEDSEIQIVITKKGELTK